VLQPELAAMVPPVANRRPEESAECRRHWTGICPAVEQHLDAARIVPNSTLPRNAQSMDARLPRLALLVCALSSLGATYATPNFVVSAPTQEIAEQVGKAAEHYRVALAQEWLGRTLPKWYKPCSISVKVGQMGAGGATTFAFDRGEVFGWRMNVQGSLERILDSVIPHEVSHTIFACHFRRPLPRWADEGAATLAEDESERKRQRLLLQQILKDDRRIPLRQLLAIKEYPKDMQQVLTLYAEGYSLADFLVETGGKARYLHFVNAAHQQGWDRALKHYYELDSVEALDKVWNEWIMAGSPRLNLPAGQHLAATEASRTSNPQPRTSLTDAIVRSQTPDNPNAERGMRNAEWSTQQSAPPTSAAQAPAASPRRLELPVHSTADHATPRLSLEAQERARRDGWSTVPLTDAAAHRDASRNTGGDNSGIEFSDLNAPNSAFRIPHSPVTTASPLPPKNRARHSAAPFPGPISRRVGPRPSRTDSERHPKSPSLPDA
jgi:hypothetical protein